MTDHTARTVEVQVIPLPSGTYHVAPKRRGRLIEWALRMWRKFRAA